MPLPTFTTMRLEDRPDGVAVLTFDQPGSKANVLTETVWAEFEAAIDALATYPGVQGLVLASAKPGIFIAGADLKLLGDAKGPNDPAVRAFIDRGNRTLFKLEALPFPTCAAVDGAALGGGCEVALACDDRICGPNAKFGLPEVNLGLIPGWGGTQRLPRIIYGWENKLEVAFNVVSAGKSLNVEEAAYTSFIEEVTDSTLVLENACRRFMNENIQKSFKVRREPKFQPLANVACSGFLPAQSANTKVANLLADVMTRGAALPLREAIALETEVFMQLAGGDESKRLIAAFFASRKK